jgi:hypothetical protein
MVSFNVGETCPYYATHKTANLDMLDGEVLGIYGPYGEYYKKVNKFSK